MNDTDTQNRLLARYSALTLPERAVFLANLGEWLTFVGRDTYDPKGGLTNPERLRGINEAQHRILEQLSHMLAYQRYVYPDDAFAGLLIEIFCNSGIDPASMLRFLPEQRHPPHR